MRTDQNNIPLLEPGIDMARDEIPLENFSQEFKEIPENEQNFIKKEIEMNSLKIYCSVRDGEFMHSTQPMCDPFDVN